MITDKSIWVARDESKIPDDFVHFVERHPEKEYEFAKLHVFYDTPLWNGSEWKCARNMHEIPNYMFPEIKPGICAVFKFNKYSKKNHTIL